MRRIPRSLWLFALLLAFVISSPYIVGALNTPEGWQYSGAVDIPVGFHVDYNSRMVMMWQGSRGQWDYHLLFTHEEHPGIPTVQGFYVALGALANVTPFDFTAVYHIIRFALTVAMVLALWAFACRFFERNSERWLAVLFGTVVAGWSWILALVAPGMTTEVSPIEFWLFDAYNLLGALYVPHFVAAIILQIVAFLAFDLWISNIDDKRQIVIMTLALAADSIIQPYVVLLTVPLFAILAAYHIFSTRKLAFTRALWLVLPLGAHGGIALCQYISMSADPVWAAFVAQNITASPDPIYYLLGYLPFIIPIVAGSRLFLSGGKADDVWWIPLLWITLVAVLLYGPFPTQRRYLLGVQTPLAVLAAYGWSRAIKPRFLGGYGIIATGVYLTLAAVGLIMMVLSNVLAVSNLSENTDVFYQPDELAGYAWLRSETDSDDLVLTTFDWTGNGSGGRLAAMTGRRVFMGHWIETANFDGKIEQIERFYNPATDGDWRRRFLRDISADYIWYDDYAREFGDWNPAGVDWLERVFELGSVEVYRFHPNNGRD